MQVITKNISVKNSKEFFKKIRCCEEKTIFV